MHAEVITNIFTPLLSDAHARFTKRDKPTTEYARTVFSPLLEAVGRAAGVDVGPAVEHLTAMDPATITMNHVNEAVGLLTAPTAVVSIDIEAARARQEEIEADIASVPLTERGIVLMERKMPLAKRSADSILRELFEIRTGYVRLASADENGGWSSQEQLPGIVVDLISADNREATLKGELDRRDCEAHGVTYKHATKRDHSLDMVRPMRG